MKIPENTKSRPQELTRAELEIMQLFWAQGPSMVNGLLDAMPEPKPAYNTVSTVVRILEKGSSATRPTARPTNIIRSSRKRLMQAVIWIPCSIIFQRVVEQAGLVFPNTSPSRSRKRMKF